MKKFLSMVLSVVTLVSGLSVVACAQGETKPTASVYIRDPFVLTYDGKYYMYGTGAAHNGYGCYVSEDLENWSGPYTVFSADSDPDFDGIGDYWAPECHYYKGSFYLFATYKSKDTEFRGTGIFKADNPLGPFELISNGHVTPKYRDCIDGTLYVDEDGQPWIIYVNEWTCNDDGIGEMAASKLTEDLSQRVGVPKVLFAANNHVWTDEHVTDGPFLYKTKDGRLIMLWSNVSDKGYAVGVAWSDNNKVDGNWYHQPVALYQKGTYYEYNGGHAMLFEDLNGQLTMALHSPNGSTPERPTAAMFIPVKDTGDTVVIKSDFGFFKNILYFFRRFFLFIYYKFSHIITRIISL